MLSTSPMQQPNAVVAYQTAFLRCHYQKEFMAALLTSVLGNTNKVSEYIYACRKMGIKITFPHGI